MRQAASNISIILLIQADCGRADERTRTAHLISLRVIKRVLQAFAPPCKRLISKPVSFLFFALCCTVLRSRWCQSGVNVEDRVQELAGFVGPWPACGGCFGHERFEYLPLLVGEVGRVGTGGFTAASSDVETDGRGSASYHPVPLLRHPLTPLLSPA